jgi:hypothetical protein
MVEADKDPRKVKAGRIGSRARWGEPRIVRLDALAPTVAMAIRALVEADLNAKKAVTEGQSPVTAGGGGGRDTYSAD